MRFRLFGALAAAVLPVALAGLARPQAPAAGAPFRLSLHVIVLDRRGVPAADLTPADVTVTIGGVPADVVRVAPADSPLDVALLVDHCTRYPLELRAGLKAFIIALPVTSRTAIVTAGGAPTPLVRSTDDPTVLVDALGRLTSRACIGLHAVDAIREAYRSPEIHDAARAAVLVVVGHGGDASTEDVSPLLAAMRESRAPLFVVRFPADQTNMPGEQSNLAALLTEGPAFTGGRRIDVLGASALRAQLERVAGWLAEQQRVDVTLDAPPPAGRLLRLEVGTTRQGYVALAPVALRIAP